MPTLYSLPPLLEEQKWILITAGKWFLRLAAAHLFSAGQEHPAACSPLWSLTLGNLATPKTHHSPTLRLILLILFHQRKSSLSLYDYDYSCQVEFTFQIVLLIPSSWNSSSRDITTTTGTSQSLPSWPGGDLIYHCHCSKVATLPDYDTPVAAAHLLLTAIQFLLKITFSLNF